MKIIYQISSQEKSPRLQDRIRMYPFCYFSDKVNRDEFLSIIQNDTSIMLYSNPDAEELPLFDTVVDALNHYKIGE